MVSARRSGDGRCLRRTPCRWPAYNLPWPRSRSSSSTSTANGENTLCRGAGAIESRCGINVGQFRYASADGGNADSIAGNANYSPRSDRRSKGEVGKLSGRCAASGVARNYGSTHQEVNRFGCQLIQATVMRPESSRRTSLARMLWPSSQSSNSLA